MRIFFYSGIFYGIFCFSLAADKTSFTTNKENPSSEFFGFYIIGKKDENLLNWQNIIQHEDKDSPLIHSTLHSLEKYFLEYNKNEAGFLLGQLYIEGKKVGQDIEKGLFYLEKSSEHGLKEASFYLGKIFLEGTFFSQDKEMGLKYLEKAVSQKDLKAASYLGRLYHSGRFLEKDTEKAIYYFKEAAFLGDQAAEEIAIFLEKQAKGSQHKNLPWMERAKENSLSLLSFLQRETKSFLDFLEPLNLGKIIKKRG